MNAVLCAITAVMGLFLSVHAIRGQIKAKQSKSWPTAPGKIVDSRMREVKSRKGRTYQAYILFEYSVNGISHRSSNWNLAEVESSSSFTGGVKRALARYPIGSDVMVYFNPENPTEAVLEPGKASWFLVICGAAFLLSGVVGFFASIDSIN